MTRTVTVREDDLRLLMEYAGKDVPAEDGEHEANVVLARCAEALEATEGSEEEGGTAPEPDLPPGRYARVEIPGFRQNTGWVTEETRFGVQCAVVRDWSGVVEAEVVIGPGSRVVYLPTPLKRPEPQAAIECGTGGFGYEVDGPDERICICGPDAAGEAPDFRPDCPEHGNPF